MWTRQHYRNREDAKVRRENGTPEGMISPWYALSRFESNRGDSVCVGYADEEMSSYVLTLNGHVVSHYDTKAEVRQARTRLQRQYPEEALQWDEEGDSDIDFNIAKSFVSKHGYDVQSMSKSDLREAIEEIDRDRTKYYDISDVEVEQEEDDE